MCLCALIVLRLPLPFFLVVLLEDYDMASKPEFNKQGEIKHVAASIAADLVSLDDLSLAAQKLRESIARTMQFATASGLQWKDIRKDLLHAISSTTETRDGKTVPRWSAGTSNLILSTLKLCWEFRLMIPVVGLANPDRFKKAGAYQDWDGKDIQLVIPVNARPPKEPDDGKATTPAASTPAASTRPKEPEEHYPTSATLGTDDGLNPIQRMLAYVDRADKEGNGEPFRVYLNMVEVLLSLKKDTLRATMRHVAADTLKAMEAKKK